MDLFEVLVERVDGNVEPGARHQASLVERILVRVTQRDELVVLLEVGKRETGGPAHRILRRRHAPFEIRAQRVEFAAPRQSVETAHAHVDGVDFATADERHEIVADLLQAQPLAHEFRMVAGHFDRAFVAEKIRRVQHVDVQHVALDPFAAIDEPAQRAQRTVDADAEDVLHRVHRAHLVGDGADAADARGDVGRLGVLAPAQERLEKTRRLEDTQLAGAHATTLDRHVHRALAFDAREVVDLDRPGAHDFSSSAAAMRATASRNAGAPALKVR